MNVNFPQRNARFQNLHHSDPGRFTDAENVIKAFWADVSGAAEVQDVGAVFSTS